MEDEGDSEDLKSEETLGNRISRKIGEKHRRDRINKHIHSLSEEIPWSAANDHRLDKSQILRLTVNYLKLHHGLKKKRKCAFLPKLLSKETLQVFLQELPSGQQKCMVTIKTVPFDYVLVLLCLHHMNLLKPEVKSGASEGDQISAGGFIIIVSQTGNVLFASKFITKLLGHSVVDLIGKPVYNIIHQDDHDLFKAQFETSHTHISSQTKRSKCVSLAPVSTFKNHQRSFAIRMQTLLDKDKSQYEYVHMLAHIKNNQWSSSSKENKHSILNEVWMTAFGRSLKDQSIQNLSLMDMNKLEFCSQHGMDGSIWFTDQRVAQCLGELPSEKIGLSCYDSIDPDDLQAVAVSHMKIMTDGEVPSTFFRICPPHGRTVYIQSRSVVVRDMWTKEPRFISSINIVIPKEEGEMMLKEQRKKVKALIAMTKGLSLQTDGLSSEMCSDITQSGPEKCPTNSTSPNSSPTSSNKSSQSSVSNTPLLKSLLLRCDSPERELYDIIDKDTNETTMSTSKQSTSNPVSNSTCWSAASVNSCYTDVTSHKNQTSRNQNDDLIFKDQHSETVFQNSVSHSNNSWITADGTDDTLDAAMDFDHNSLRKIPKMDCMSVFMKQDFSSRSPQGQSSLSATSAKDTSMSSSSPVSQQSSTHSLFSPDSCGTRNDSAGSASSLLHGSCGQADPDDVAMEFLSQECRIECNKQTKQGSHNSTNNTVGYFTASSFGSGRGDNLSFSCGTRSYESLSSSTPFNIPHDKQSDLLLPMDTGNVVVSVDNPTSSNTSNIPKSNPVSLSHTKEGITKGDSLDGIYHKWSHQLHAKHNLLDQFLCNQQVELNHLRNSFIQVQHSKAFPGTAYGSLTQKLQILQNSVDDQRASLSELKEEHKKNLHKY